MCSRWAILLVCLLVFLLTNLAFAADCKLSGEQRQQIIRAFLAEHAYAHRALPLGKPGIVIDGSTVLPSEREVVERATAARASDRVEITGVRFQHEGILFEINGGAGTGGKWQDRIHVGLGGPSISPGQPTGPDRPKGNVPAGKDLSGKDAVDGRESEAKGAFVLLKLGDGDGVTADRIKTLLAPVLDFGSVSHSEAYQKNLSPVLTAALREHRALVGMDRDMVIEAKGRPTRRLRETADGAAYEEWIYGTPPEEVQFIRFVGGKVVRIEQMKVTGEKLVRTENEVGKVNGVLDASAPAAVAAPAMAAPLEATPAATSKATVEAPRKKPPTLLHPGEARATSN